MNLYREKVEHQKKLREKFVQMKEEQRLKNQMQSFIQNNIKGKKLYYLLINLRGLYLILDKTVLHNRY